MKRHIKNISWTTSISQSQFLPEEKLYRMRRSNKS